MSLSNLLRFIRLSAPLLLGITGIVLTWIQPKAFADNEPNTTLATKRLTSWKLTGTLIDKEKIVRNFLTPIMNDSSQWYTEDQEEVVDFLFRFGYYCKIENTSVPGGIVATLSLSPLTRVRHIKIDIDESLLKRFWHPLFSDEIRKHMTLRPGAVLALEGKSRNDQLLLEEKRLQEYLIHDGFYDAKITISETSTSPFVSELDIEITPGSPYFIGTIEVNGNARIPTSEIQELFEDSSLFGSNRFSYQTFLENKKRLKEIYQKRGYPGVTVKDNFAIQHSFNRKNRTVTIRLDVRERRQVYVEFQGNKNISSLSLENILTLSEMGSYDDVEVEASAEALREYYQSKGYFEIQVEWSREFFSDVNYEHILFRIAEGPSLPVRSVSIYGNRALSSSSLLGVLRTREYKRIVLGDGGGYTTTKQLQEDIRLIQEEYRKTGFLQTQIELQIGRDKQTQESPVLLATEVAARNSASGLYVTFVISEGPQTKFDTIRFQFRGDHKFSSQSFLHQLKSRPDLSFREETIQEDVKLLKRFYRDRGFIRAQVEAFHEIDSRQHKVTVVYQITENTLAHVGDTVIRGNFKTDRWVINSLLAWEKGQPLTQIAMETAQANMRQSNLFASVQFYFLGQDNPRQSIVPVLIQVTERHDFGMKFQGSVGLSTDSRLFVEAGLQFPNIGGQGIRLDSLLHFGQRQIFGDLKLLIPDWVVNRYTGARVNFNVRGGYRLDDTQRFGDLVTTSFTVGISQQWNLGLKGNWFASFQYDYRHRNRDINFARPAGASDFITQTKVSTESSAIGPRLLIDKRRARDGTPNPLNPARGYQLEFKASFAEDFLVGTARYIKVGFTAQHFLSLGKRITIGNSLQYDQGFPLGGRSLLPEVERYFGGGDTSVRGYENDHLATEIVSEPLATTNSVARFRSRPAGGNIRFVHKFDLQLQVWDDPWGNFPVATGAFFDTGFIINSLSDLRRDDFRFGAGVTFLRWLLPFGTLSFEYAYPINPKPGDSTRGRAHIKLGVFFN